MPRDDHFSFLTSQGVSTCSATSAPNVVILSQTTGLTSEDYHLTPSGPVTYYLFPGSIPMQVNKQFNFYADLKNCKVGDVIWIFAHTDGAVPSGSMTFNFLPNTRNSSFFLTHCGGGGYGGSQGLQNDRRLGQYFIFDGELLSNCVDNC